MEPYASGQFGSIDDLGRQFGNGSVWTGTRTRSDGPEPLLSLGERLDMIFRCHQHHASVWQIHAASGIAFRTVLDSHRGHFFLFRPSFGDL